MRSYDLLLQQSGLNAECELRIVRSDLHLGEQNPITKYIHRQWWIHVVRRLYGFFGVVDKVLWVVVVVDDDNGDGDTAVVVAIAAVDVVYFVLVIVVDVVVIVSSSIFSIIFLLCYWKGNMVVLVRRRYSFRLNQCTSYFPHKCLSRRIHSQTIPGQDMSSTLSFTHSHTQDTKTNMHCGTYTAVHVRSHAL